MLNYSYYGNKLVFEHQDSPLLGLKLLHMSNFNPLEIVGRDSQTQFQMGENVFTYFTIFYLAHLF